MLKIGGCVTGMGEAIDTRITCEPLRVGTSRLRPTLTASTSLNGGGDNRKVLPAYKKTEYTFLLK